MKCNCQQINRSRVLMNQVVRISIVAPAGCCVEKAMDAGFEAIERLQHLTESINPVNKLSQINSARAGAIIPVPNQIWQMLRIANDIAYRTDGIFDVVAAGTGGAAEWTDLDLSLPGAIRMRKKLRLSLGGLARGFAVDLAVQALKEMGAGAGLVDIGGCIRAFGQRAWRVDYGTTYDLATASTSPGIPVVVHDSAIAGIGSMFDRVTLVDPHRKQVSSTQGWVDHNLLVRAKSCAVADALTKVSALNMEESTQLLMPFGADAITLSRTGAEPLKQMH